MKTLVNITKLPVVLQIANTTDTAKQLPLYPNNGFLTLNPEEQIVITVDKSRDYLYYYTTCKGIGLELSEVSPGV